MFLQIMAIYVASHESIYHCILLYSLYSAVCKGCSPEGSHKAHDCHAICIKYLKGGALLVSYIESPGAVL